MCCCFLLLLLFSSHWYDYFSVCNTYYHWFTFFFFLFFTSRKNSFGFASLFCLFLTLIRFVLGVNAECFRLAVFFLLSMWMFEFVMHWTLLTDFFLWSVWITLSLFRRVEQHIGVIDFADYVNSSFWVESVYPSRCLFVPNDWRNRLFD